MNVLGVAAAVLYVFAFLSTWPLGLSQNIGHGIAFAAAGLLCALLAGAGPVVARLRRSPGE